MFIHGKLYNLDNFDHPGGMEILNLCKNEPDCTAFFESYHAFCNMDKIKRIMKKYEVQNVKSGKTMFNFNKNGFYTVCKHRVRNYIQCDSKANCSWLTTVFFSTFLFIFCQYQLLFASFVDSLINLLFGSLVSSLFKILCSLLSGISLVFLGFNVLHDGSHYAISKYPFINNCCSKLIQPLLLWNHTLWTYHHCIRHHQYTGNILYDPDLINTSPFFRKSNKIKSKPYQFTKNHIDIKLLLFNIFIPGTLLGQSLLYHFFWVRKGFLWKMTLPSTFGKLDDILQYLLSLLFIFIEIYYGGLFYFYLHIIGTNIAYFIGSAPDHDMYSTHKEIDNNQDIRLDWGENQVRHSGNFLNNNVIFSKLMGGINYQIEHHLFPTLCNHKLMEIAPIVKQCCKEFNIPYVCINNPLKIVEEVCDTYRDVHH